MAFRIIFSILLLLSVLFLPFWLTVMLAIAGVFLFSTYWESIALLLLSDLLFGAKEVRFFDETLVTFALGALFMVGAELLKKKLKFYNNR